MFCHPQQAYLFKKWIEYLYHALFKTKHGKSVVDNAFKSWLVIIDTCFHQLTNLKLVIIITGIFLCQSLDLIRTKLRNFRNFIAVVIEVSNSENFFQVLIIVVP